MAADSSQHQRRGRTIGGGELNRIRTNAFHSTIAGGNQNVVGTNAIRSFIGGGEVNHIRPNAAFSTVPGGVANEAGGFASFAAGNRAKALHDGSFVWADSLGADFASSTPNQFLIRALGGVGIGTTTPRAPLEILGNWNGEQGALNLAGDRPSIRFTGDANSANQSWLIHLGGGSGNLEFYRRTGPGAWANALTLHANGNVGIGTANPPNTLYVVGSAQFLGTTQVGAVSPINDPERNAHTLIVWGDLFVYGRAFKPGGGTWEFSDRRLKQDVRTYEPGLEQVVQLQPVRFRYRDNVKEGLTSAREGIGLIAQEVREVIPDAVSEEQDGYLTLNADPIHWAAINAIKELNAKLEKQLKAKEAHLQALEQRLERLEKLLGALTP